MHHTSSSEAGISTFAVMDFDGTHDSFMRIGKTANQMFAATQAIWRSMELLGSSIGIEDQEGVVNTLHPGMVFIFAWNAQTKSGGCLVVSPEGEYDESLYASVSPTVLNMMDATGDLDLAVGSVFDIQH